MAGVTVEPTSATEFIDKVFDSVDEGIGSSLSSSLAGSASSIEELSRDASPFDFAFVARLIREMALDLRKSAKFKRFSSDEDEVFDKAPNDGDDVQSDARPRQQRESVEEEALDLTARSAFTPVRPPLPPLPRLMPVGPSEAIKNLSDQERLHLRHAYYRVARFLQLDATDGKRFPEDFRRMALRRLQAFLFMYLDEVKKKSPAGLTMFQHSFGTDRSIRQFFCVFLGKSEQLGRPVVVRQARFATDEAPPQILCRGPTHHERQNRSASFNNAPYPMRQHRELYPPAASSVPSALGWRGGHHHMMPAKEFVLAGQRAGSAFHPPESFARDVPMDSEPSTYEDLNVQEVIDIVCKLFPLDDRVKGLTLPDFAELYGVDAFTGSDAMDDTSSSSAGSCRTPLYASDSFPSSPVSPLIQPQYPVNYHQAAWSPASSTCSLPLSPRCAASSVFMSPAPSSSSATSSPAPGSPLPRSMESQMTRMSLINSGPPPLIPINPMTANVIQSSGSPRVPQGVVQSVNSIQNLHRMSARSPQQQQQQVPSPPSVPSPASKSQALFPPLEPLAYRTAVEEMTSGLDPAVKEHSMRQVVKSSMDALTCADEDGDTPLMVACANPAYKNEDLYALIERLKSHPEPAKVFGAVNKKRETALFLAACERRPLVAGYLAETMAALRIPLNQLHQKGNTLVHYLAMWGDECSEVLQYLVRVRTADDRPAFDLNILNHMGRSALHEAVTNYQANDAIGEGFIKCIQLLLDHGADAGLSDITSGKTPVHIAIEKRDPALLELLLVKCPKAANAPMYNDNRPLHSAATLSGVTDAQQLELVNILLKHGADKALRNKANKLPIELVQQDRDRVKAVLQARSRSNQYGL